MHPEVYYHQRPLHERVPDYERRMRIIEYGVHVELEMAKTLPHSAPINKLSLVPKEDPHNPVRTYSI